MTNLLDLPLDQFRGYLAEGNYPQERQDELVRAYRAQNSLSGLLDRYGEEGLDGKNVSTFFPVAGPGGMSIFDALKSGQLQTRFKDYASDALGGVLGALENPKASYDGTLPQADYDGAAMGTAGLAMGGGGVVAGRNAMAYDPNTTNIFAGRRADFTAQPPDKNPGMTSLDDANKMLADGKSNREIYNETGWFQGADGKFRFEIDDKDAKLTLPRWLRNNMLDGETTPFRLDQILDHPEFYKAYPDAARKQVNLSRPDGYSSTMGSYNPYTDVISARIDRPDDDVLGTILHEVQHSTQRREGFSGGANPETSKEQAREFSNVIMSDPKVGSLYDSSDKFSQLSMQLQPLYRADYIDSLDNLVEKARNGGAKPRDITGIQDWYIHGFDIVSKQGAMPRRNGPERDQWIAQAAHYIRREALARDADSVRSVYDEYPSVKDRKNAIRRFERQRDKHRAAHFEYAKVGKSVEDLRGLSSWDAYQREAGETEARNVQTRLELGREGDKRSPAQDGVFPGDTQDFAFTDQVVSNLRRGQPVPSVRSNKLNANASAPVGLLAAQPSTEDELRQYLMQRGLLQ